MDNLPNNNQHSSVLVDEIVARDISTEKGVLEKDSNVDKKITFPLSSEEKEVKPQRMKLKHQNGRRYKRWLNQRFLMGNLRRVIYESGEDLTDVENCQGMRKLWDTHRYIYSAGRRISVAPGIKDILNQTRITPWTRLRNDWECSEAFRKRKCLNNDDSSTAFCSSHGIHSSFMDVAEAILAKRIYRTFFPLKRLICKMQHKLLSLLSVLGPQFIMSFLSSLEHVLVETFQTRLTQKENNSDLCVFFPNDAEGCSKKSDTSFPPSNKPSNCWMLLNRAALERLEPDDALSHANAVVLKSPQDLLLLGLSRLHRRLAHSLASVWGLPCIHLESSAMSSESFSTARFKTNEEKLLLIRMETNGKKELQLPAFPVAENLLAILSSSPETATITRTTYFDEENKFNKEKSCSETQN